MCRANLVFFIQNEQIFILFDELNEPIGVWTRNFLKFFGEHRSLFVGQLVPVLDFWWYLSWISKPGWIHHLCASSPVCNGFLWCDICWPLDGKHWSQASFWSTSFSSIGGTGTWDCVCCTVCTLTIWATSHIHNLPTIYLITLSHSWLDFLYHVNLLPKRWKIHLWKNICFTCFTNGDDYLWLIDITVWIEVKTLCRYHLQMISSF